MSLANSLLQKHTQDELNIIYKDTDVDCDKIETTLKLLKEWLKCENHLPKDIDENVLRNFVIGCKGNLEKIKGKLERYLVVKTKISYLFDDRVVKDETFSVYPYNRFVYISPKLTSEGYRIIMGKVPRKDHARFEFLIFAKYFCTIFEILLYNDTAGGYHFIFDVQDFSAQYWATFNFSTLKHVAEIMFKIMPFRIKSFTIANETPSMTALLPILKLFMSKKLRERIFYMKADEFVEHYPKDCLPKEYGGNQGVYNENSDRILEVLKQNEEWCRDSEGPKLIGPIPDDKKKLYSFEEFSMDGSFRQLSID